MYYIVIWHLHTLRDDHNKTSNHLSPIPSYYSITDHIPYAPYYYSPMTYLFSNWMFVPLDPLHLFAPMHCCPPSSLPLPLWQPRVCSLWVCFPFVLFFCFYIPRVSERSHGYLSFFVWFISYPLDISMFLQMARCFLNGKMPFFNEEIMAFSEHGRFKIHVHCA